VVVIHNKFGLFEPNEARVAAIGLVTLVLPFGVACNQIFNSIDAQTKYLSMRPDDKLHDIVHPFIENLQLDVTVSQYVSDEVNAFALSSILGKKAVIAFSSKMVEISSPEQLIAFAAHEVAHVKHGDSHNKALIVAFYAALMFYPALLSELGKKYFMFLVPLFLVLLAVSFASVAHFAGTARAISQLTPITLLLARWAAIAALFILGFFALRYVLRRNYFAYSQAREFAADAAAAAMTSPEAVVSALELLDTSIASVGVFDTHPPLAERIARLAKPCQ
jgi:Zn-dependent protease with chaperone function